MFFCFLSFEKKITLKRKSILPRQANYFLLEIGPFESTLKGLDPFQKGFDWYAEKQTRSYEGFWGGGGAGWGCGWGEFTTNKFQDGQLSVSGERMCTILVNRLEN